MARGWEPMNVLLHQHKVSAAYTEPLPRSLLYPNLDDFMNASVNVYSRQPSMKPKMIQPHHPMAPAPQRIPIHDTLQILTLLAIVFLSILSLAIRPPLQRRAIFAIIVGLSYYLIWKTQSNDMVRDYSLGLWVATNVFLMNDFVGLCCWDVQRQVMRLAKGTGERKARRWNQKGEAELNGGPEQVEGRKEEIWTRPFTERLQWAFELWIATRGVGWEHEVPGLRRHSTSTPTPTNSTSRKGRTTHRAFIRTQILELAKCALLYFIGDVLMQMNPSFQTHGPAFDKQVWWFKPTVLGHVLAARGSINATYIVGSLLWVGVRLLLSKFWITKDEDKDLLDEWPPLFGSFLEAWSVRNVWRRVWHQMMRRFLLVHGAFVANLLHARNYSTRALVNLYTAFFISAFIHYLGDYAIFKDWRGGSIVFFMLQPVAITFEQLVRGLLRTMGIRLPGWLAKVGGYAWVLAWFTATLPIWVEPVVRAGFMEDGWHGPVVLWVAEKLRPGAAKWE